MMRMPASDGSTCLAYTTYEKDTGRKLFVKQLRPELTEREEYRTLFRKEFDVGRQLSSRYFPRYHELNEDGLPYITMDFVEGMTLAQTLAETPSRLKGTQALLHITLQLAEALRDLHTHNILHLDLKTSNILLTQRTNNVVLIDLGFCSASGWMQSMGRNSLFQSPEQQSGSLESICAATDIYALGRIVLTLAECTETELPSWFRSILQRCTEADPTHRFASASELLKALHAQTSHVRRQRILRIVSGILVLTAIAFGLMQVPSIRRSAITAWYSHTTPETFSIGENKYRVTSWVDATAELVKADLNPKYDIHASVNYRGRDYTVTSIGRECFSGYKHLISIVFPPTLERIGPQAFAYCDELTTINIPASVTEIADSVFWRCFKMRDVQLPPHLSNIHRRVLSECQDMTNIVIPKGVTTLGYDSFAGCTRLQHIEIPEGVRIIERGVFWLCPELQEVEIPSTVEEFGDFVFWYSGLRTLIMHPTTPPLATNIFGNQDSFPHIRIIVPRGTADAYRARTPWNRCTIVEAEQTTPVPDKS